jgi:hypothetical protein
VLNNIKKGKRVRRWRRERGKEKGTGNVGKSKKNNVEEKKHIKRERVEELGKGRYRMRKRIGLSRISNMRTKRKRIRIRRMRRIKMTVNKKGKIGRRMR